MSFYFKIISATFLMIACLSLAVVSCGKKKSSTAAAASDVSSTTTKDTNAFSVANVSCDGKACVQ